MGIFYPPNAFFVIAFAFLLLLLLHISTIVSRLADETRVLAQRLGLLEVQPSPVLRTVSLGLMTRSWKAFRPVGIQPMESNLVRTLDVTRKLADRLAEHS